VTEYYVGCKVRLKIRFENNVDAFTPPQPSAPNPNSGAESFGSGTNDDILEQAAQFVLIGRDLVPTQCTVELNNYRKADTAKMTFQLAELPFDPRLIRAIAVQVFGGVYTPEEWAAGQVPGADGLLLPDVNQHGPTELFRGFVDKHSITINDTSQEVMFDARDLTGELLDAEIPPNQLEDLPGFLRLDEAIQLLLTGDALAATETLDARFEEESKRALGRDRRRLLKDARAQDAVAADAAASGDDAAAAAARAQAAYLREDARVLKTQGSTLKPRTRRFGLPGFRGISVVNEVRNVDGGIDPLPTIDEIRPKAWVDSRGVSKKGRKRSPGNRQKTAYWDFITDLVISAGFIPLIRTPRQSAQQLVASELVITNPRTYYRESTTAGDTTPPPTSTRTFVYGANIEELNLARNLKGTATPTIKLNGFDVATGTRYSGIWPPLGKNNRPTPTGNGDRDEIKVFNLDSVAGGSPEEIIAALTRAAASIYEQLARGDFEVQIRTPVLSALPENLEAGLVGDVFAMRPKDPIAVELPAEDPTTGIVSSALILAEGSDFQRSEQARQAGLPVEDALRYAALSRSEYLQREFRTKKLTLAWDINSGWQIAGDAINYLDVSASIQVTETRTGIDVPS